MTHRERRGDDHELAPVTQSVRGNQGDEKQEMIERPDRRDMTEPHADVEAELCHRAAMMARACARICGSFVPTANALSIASRAAWTCPSRYRAQASRSQPYTSGRILISFVTASST